MQTVLQVPMTKENVGRRAFTLSLSCSEDEDRGELVCTGLIFI